MGKWIELTDLDGQKKTVYFGPSGVISVTKQYNSEQALLVFSDGSTFRASNTYNAILAKLGGVLRA